MDKKKKIWILATGGTIAGKAKTKTDLTSYEAGAMNIEELLAAVPGLEEIADVTAEQFCNLDSKDMSGEILLGLSERVNELAKKKATNGIVITHGTDTMEETAFFLDLLYQEDLPVVLTGAMRPATALSADGPLNLLQAVQTAVSEETAGRGVLVVMNDQIFTARDVTKRNTTAVEAFVAPETGPVGEIREGQPAYYREKPFWRTFLFSDEDFNRIREVSYLPEVYCIYGNTGGSPELIRAALQAGARGLVYAGCGNGSVHQDDERELALAVQKGIPVVRSTRTGSGAVTTAALSYEKEGFLASGCLNPQKTRILLQLLLAAGKTQAEIAAAFCRF